MEKDMEKHNASRRDQSLQINRQQQNHVKKIKDMEKDMEKHNSPILNTEN